MDGLSAARWQMELSLGFHIVFAAFGIGMPLLMLLAEGLYLRTGAAHYRELARTWGKATALLFVVGAVSGTALSFELGLLWPKFMAFAGPVIGPAFALEGYAFLIEAIFIGLYLYGWERLTPRQHWLSGVPVAISGVMSGVLVVGANAWMQSPRGYREVGGRVVDVDTFATFANPSWLPLSLHSTLSCTIAVGFAVAGVYAVGLLRGRDDAYHRSGLILAMALGAISAALQPLSGDQVAKLVGKTQPEKLAAMEAHFHTQAGAPLLIGGVPDAATAEVRFGLHVPKGLSFLATGDPNATIKGLHDFPLDERPNVLISHFAFQAMVGAGFALVAVGVAFFLVRRLRRGETPRWLLGVVAAAAPLGFVALEAGWIVTEVGRQPWIIYRVMRTRDAITPRADVGVTLATYTALYFVLAVVLVILLRGLAEKRKTEAT
ncbi:MAG: cytochrome ubiquinol oxidase subunit I [Deltaproteobacteria bacterium]|nr:cytochrome ubiquinol oxidase subunit I [Deltaproteobacteria bacterium]